MLSTKLQTALSELGQVDILVEMIVNYLASVPTEKSNKEWLEKVENALYLLESTYKDKKTGLIAALNGGDDRD